MTTPGGNKEEEYYYYEEDEQDWILDSITEFLKSPVWKNPILQFIDEHCVVFDEEEENKLEYTTLHKQFKELVDTKLDKFVGELGISTEMFVTACEVASQKIHKSIVNQLLAVENFLLFKKMMITRNKQLNEEAVKHFKEGGKEEIEEDLEEKAAKEREEAELQQAIAMSQALEEKKQQIKPQKPKEEVKKEEPQTQSALPGLPGISPAKKQAMAFEEINIEEDPEEQARKEQDMHERQQRLKIQRDQLINKKKEERDHEIDQYHQSKEGKGQSEEEAKNERIKKGLAALNMGGGPNQDDIQQKRMNFMGQIRDALIAGEGESEGVKKKKKKPKKTTEELL